MNIEPADTVDDRTQYDTGFPLVCNLEDQDGFLFADSGGLAGKVVMFCMVNARTRRVKVYAPCTLVDVALSKVQYDWRAADVNEAGDYECSFRVLDGVTPLVTVPTGSFFALRIGRSGANARTPQT